ncbi:hypothetical protein [Polaribacter sp.]|uniref:hypothetical protein n=1 Tax=Polaribacter sp. TaxID=1920175 RepID=UPI003F6C6AEA
MKVFKEEQRFTQLWLIVLIAISLIVPIVIILQEYLKEETKMTTTQFVLTTTGILASTLFFFAFKLTSRIDEKGIYYKFFPFHLKFKQIMWNEISKAYVRTYDPIGEYGGWGLKGGFFWRKSKGSAINVSGDVGLQLELKSGKKLLLGTQKKTEVINVLKTYENKIHD